MNEYIDNIKDYIDKLCSNKRKLGKVILIMLILVIAAVLRINKNAESNVTVETKQIESEQTDTQFYVDISGEVNFPGVYEVGSETRLFEVIEKAGGLTDRADSNSINQAEFIEDGEKIVIPAKTVSEGNNSTGENVDVEQDDGKININTASKDKLMDLSGVGDKIADRIIEYRQKTPFKTVEDIMSVKGIGSSIFEKNKDKLKV